MSITHHDHCFGCGPSNAAGIRVQLERDSDGAVSGRFLVEPHHQGPPGYAHGGIVAAALDEAMSLAVHAEGVLALTARLEIDLRAPAPVGAFVVLSARVAERGDGKLRVTSRAHTDDEDHALIAEGVALFVEQRSDS